MRDAPPTAPREDAMSEQREIPQDHELEERLTALRARFDELRGRL